MKIRSVMKNGRPAWRVNAVWGGKQRRWFFASKAAAEAKAAELRERQQAAGEQWAALDGPERAAALRAIAEMARAGVSIADVWKHWQTSKAEIPSPGLPLGEVLRQLLESKEAAGRRAPYLGKLRCILGQFVRGREQSPIGKITLADLDAWLDAHSATQWTRATHLACLRTLFGFAVRRGIITADPAVRLEAVTVEPKRPEILSVRATGILLRLCARKCPEILAGLVLEVFCGLRPSEAQRLRWADVDLERGLIVLDAAATKTRTRRIVTIPGNALEWLRNVRRAGPLVLPSPATVRRRARRLRALMGAPRIPQDILRHTAASYMVASRGARETAEQLGHSESILFRHYRELVPRPAADEFFHLTPAEAA